MVTNLSLEESLKSSIFESAALALERDQLNTQFNDLKMKQAELFEERDDLLIRSVYMNTYMYNCSVCTCIVAYLHIYMYTYQ
jgi:predicted dithiol-disulfide oxidoreductase (DUF899 family)